MPDILDITDERRPAEQGQAAAEFAIVLPLLMIVLFGIVEFGMAFWNYQQISASASEGARRASISRTYSDRNTRVCNAVVNAAPQLNMSCSNVSISSTWAAGSTVSVTVRRHQTIKILNMTLYNKDLTATRTFRVEQ